MKRLLGFFKNRWVISILGLIAICVLIWFVGPLIAFAGNIPLASPTSRLLGIIICVVIWGLNNLRIQASVSRANADLVSGMAEDPMLEQDTGDARSHEEVELLKGRFDEALQTLRKTSRKNGGAGIYDLPWYIIIGPPGSGKTTALLNSGLKFPLAEKFGESALRGVGGTRNCDWWFTEEAVLLDTAGRYTTQDSDARADSAAWSGFLNLLKKHRRRRPINGALVTLSLSDLLTQTEPERALQVNAIRLRLQELTKHLGVRFPVYLVFTKCDLMSGFMEFFDDLGLEERSQVWGMSFAYDKGKDAQSPASQFMAEFDLLIDRLNKRLLWKMHHERDPERRARIYSFPQQMASLRQQLNNFMSDVFAASRYEETLLLRGAYFSSGTQEGSPIDRVMGSLSRVFNVSPQAVRAFAGEGRSYFITRLLKDVIFSEADLVGANRRLETQRVWLQRFAYGGALAATAAMVLAWMTSFTRNEVYTYRFQAAVNDYQEQRDQQSNNVASFDQLLTRLNSVRSVTEVYKPFDDGVPLLMGFGLYQGDNLTESAAEVYRQELNQYLLPSIGYRMEQRIGGANDDPDLQYEALKAYLMLADEGHRDAEHIQTFMNLDWRAMYPNQPEVQGEFQNHLTAMLELGFNPLLLNENVVQDARLNLSAVPLAELLYGRMKRDYLAQETDPLRVINVTGPSGNTVFQRGSGAGLNEGITTLLTNAGYHDYFSGEINTVAALSSEENWVLDPARAELTAPEIDQLQEDLQDLYLADYIESWDTLLDDVDVMPFESISQAAEVLALIASPNNSPMRNLLREVSRNTQLARGSLLNAAADRAGQSPGRLGRLLGSAGAAVNLDSPEEIVDNHYADLNALVAQPEDGSPPIEPIFDLLDQLSTQFDTMSMGIGADLISVADGTASSGTLTRLQVEAGRQPEPVQSWLQQVARNSRQVILGGARSQINDRWQAEVMPLCTRAVNDRYPFVEDSPREIALADFGDLFGPAGLMDEFFEENIRPFVDISGNNWSWKSIGNRNIGMPNEVLTLFQQAATIRDLYFQSGSQTPSVSFRLRALYLDANVTSFRLDLEGQLFEYRHGPARLQPAQWPAPNSTGEVRIGFEDDSGAQLASTLQGPWAWFRMLDNAEIIERSDDLVEVTFVERGRRSTWEIHADTVANPFRAEQINQFSCLSRL